MDWYRTAKLTFKNSSEDILNNSQKFKDFIAAEKEKVPHRGTATEVYHLSKIISILVGRYNDALKEMSQNHIGNKRGMENDVKNKFFNRNTSNVKDEIDNLVSSYSNFLSAMGQLQSHKGHIALGAGISIEAHTTWPLVRDIVHKLVKNNYPDRDQFLIDFKDPAKQGNFWNIIAQDKTLRSSFKDEIQKAFQQHVPSKSHQYLSNILKQSECIQSIICFNWDNLLEQCQNHKLKVVITDKQIPQLTTKDILMWKPHGCVSDITSQWTLPYENSPLNTLNDAVKYHIQNINSVPVCITLGYSGVDRAISQDFLTQFMNDPQNKYCITIDPEIPKSLDDLKFGYIQFSAEEALFMMDSIFAPQNN